MGIRDTFPNEASLEARLHDMWPRIKPALGPEFVALREKVYARQSILIAIGIFLALAFGAITYIYLSLLPFFPLLPLAFYLAFAVWYWKQAVIEYVQKLNQLFYPPLLEHVLGLEVQHGTGSDEHRSSDTEYKLIRSLIDSSKLLTEGVDTRTVDDVFATNFLGKELAVAEISATRQEGSGKNRRTITVFHGVFVAYEVPVRFSGETYLSTEGDTSGFGHQDFWSSLMGRRMAEQTELEWNEFERDLHVAATSGSEARYILTPHLMQSLFDWWKEDKKNIRIAFCDSHVYLLFPDRSVNVGRGPLQDDDEKLKAYAMTIVKPLWRVLLFLEEVRVRFR